MEKIKHLIEKLNEQAENNAPLTQLLTTVQILHNEITGGLRDVEILGTSGIAVMVPNAKIATAKHFEKDAQPFKENEREYFELIVEENAKDEATSENVQSNIPSYEEIVQLKQEIKEQESFQARLSFDEPFDDFPTLSRQEKNVSKAAKQAASPRANKNTFKDLKKAISVADTILFVKKLFRGDEIMFERSISTINNFSSLNEAEHWIQRELKTKNGWLPNEPLVQQFEQLVKRRFA